MWLNSDELDELIDQTKQGPLDAKLRQELGAYRSARRIKGLEHQRQQLQTRQAQLTTYQPVASAQPLVAFKQTEVAAALELVNLQLKPKRQRSAGENTRIKQLQAQSVRVIDLPIRQATPAVIAARLDHLHQESQLVTQANSPEALAVVAGQPITTEAYQARLEQEAQVLHLKGAIYQRNRQLADPANVGQVKRLRRANGQAFNELRQLYHQLDPGQYPNATPDRAMDSTAPTKGSLENPLGRTQSQVKTTTPLRPPVAIAPPAREAVRATNLVFQATGRREMQILWQKWREDERAARAKEAEEEYQRSR